jgi:hypothetical protein
MPLKDLALPNLNGPVVLYYRGVEALENAWMENVRFEEQAGRIFLVGQLIDEVYGDHVPVRSAAVAWEAVVQYFIFTDRAAAVAYYDESRAENEPPKRWFR